MIFSIPSNDRLKKKTKKNPENVKEMKGYHEGPYKLRARACSA